MLKKVLLIPALLLASVPCLSAPKAGSPFNVELTVYNQDFALVKEDRELTLDKGINLLPVEDVAATIDATSVAFKSLTDPNSVVVREQNYQYDVVDPKTILAKSLGKKVRIINRGDGKRENLSVLEGTLIGNSDNGIVVRGDDGKIFLNPMGEIQFMELPSGLVSQPTLVWKLESSKAGAQKAEISYLANSLSWTSDYVAVVSAEDNYVDLTGWVTLTNGSGTTYENATLNLMAGDVHRVQTAMFGMIAGRMDEAKSAPEPQFAEKSFFEYHLYTLQGKTTVRDKETKQITLMTASRVPAKKIYIYDGGRDWWNSWRYSSSYRPGESYDRSANKKVNVVMEVVNSKPNNLGVPLPKGKIRVYKAEENANQHFVGEDMIDHTPKDEKIRLNLGDAFDIVGTRTRTDFHMINKNSAQETFEIDLRNHKDAPVNIMVVEHLLGDWKITNSSHKTYKKDASTVEIPVDVEKDGETKVVYTVVTKW